MQVRMRELQRAPLPLSLTALVPLLALALALGTAALLRIPSTPGDRARTDLSGQLRAFAGWEREHRHECLVPLPDPLAVGNAHYQRHADWFLEDRGAAALLRYRTWFRATYAAEHPGGDRHDRYLIECAPSVVLGEPAWLDRYLAATAAER
jgi:hypothetical protein